MAFLTERFLAFTPSTGTYLGISSYVSKASLRLSASQVVTTPGLAMTK